MAKNEKNLQVPEEVLTSFGIDVETLKKNEKIWSALTKGEKTPLLSLKGRVGERNIPVSAKLHLWENTEGVQVSIHPVQSSINLRPYKGHEFTAAEKAMLLSSDQAQISHPVELTLGSKTMPCLIGVDQDTKEIIHLPTQNVYVPEKILGIPISKEMRETIQNGGKILMEGLKKEEKKFDAVVSFSFATNNGKGSLVFPSPTPKLLQEVRISAGLSDGKTEKKDIRKEETKTVSVPKKTKKTKGIGM